MKHLLSYFLLIFIFTSCQLFLPKPESEDFYCTIDGKAFRPDNDGDIFFEDLLAQLNENSKIFYISAYGKEGKTLTIKNKFADLKEFKVKRYYINTEFNVSYSGDKIKINGNAINEDFEPFLNSGFVEFTKIDTVRQLVSGTFEFKLKSIQTDKTVNIKNGQFNDVFYY
jgi:hypothetical protein